jgi:uncharacterized protein involved in cysteine biosynthesis
VARLWCPRRAVLKMSRSSHFIGVMKAKILLKITFVNLTLIPICTNGLISIWHHHGGQEQEITQDDQDIIIINICIKRVLVKNS